MKWIEWASGRCLPSLISNFRIKLIPSSVSRPLRYKTAHRRPLFPRQGAPRLTQKSPITTRQPPPFHGIGHIHSPATMAPAARLLKLLRDILNDDIPTQELRKFFVQVRASVLLISHAIYLLECEIGVKKRTVAPGLFPSANETRTAALYEFLRHISPRSKIHHFSNNDISKHRLNTLDPDIEWISDNLCGEDDAYPGLDLERLHVDLKGMTQKKGSAHVTEIPIYNALRKSLKACLQSEKGECSKDSIAYVVGVIYFGFSLISLVEYLVYLDASCVDALDDFESLPPGTYPATREDMEKTLEKALEGYRISSGLPLDDAAFWFSKPDNGDLIKAELLRKVLNAFRHLDDVGQAYSHGASRAR